MLHYRLVPERIFASAEGQNCFGKEAHMRNFFETKTGQLLVGLFLVLGAIVLFLTTPAGRWILDLLAKISIKGA